MDWTRRVRDKADRGQRHRNLISLSVFLPSLNDLQAKPAVPQGGALLGQYPSTRAILFVGFNYEERRLHSPYNANVLKQFENSKYLLISATNDDDKLSKANGVTS
uniref:Uncharacterized protein n=1 Tax=Glossina pallidipes TaxID=7398 RepID=A0A1A9ZZ80_GLOPL